VCVCVTADVAAVPRRLADWDGSSADETRVDERQECSPRDESECRDSTQAGLVLRARWRQAADGDTAGSVENFSLSVGSWQQSSVVDGTATSVTSCLEHLECERIWQLSWTCRGKILLPITCFKKYCQYQFKRMIAIPIPIVFWTNTSTLTVLFVTLITQRIT